MNPVIALFKLCASLKMAITLIVIIGIIVAIGTFIESYHGAQAAQILIYQTPWFSVVLLLLAFNLLTSALERWPWKEKHVGFLTTHLGIILILVGSLVTQKFGIEGQIAIQEGSSESRMIVPNPVIQIMNVKSHKLWTLRYKPAALPWTGKKKVQTSPKSTFEVALLGDYPKAFVEQKVKQANSEFASPAIKFSIAGSMAQSEEWLLLNDHRKNTISLGPATVRFSREQIVMEKRREQKGFGELIFHVQNGEAVRFVLGDEKFTKTITINGKKCKVRILRILQDAIVEDNRLINRSQEWKNPAAEIEISSGDITEKHTVFSNFPEFPTIHGRKPSVLGGRIIYQAPNSSSALLKNELRIIYEPNGMLRYQIKRGDDLKEGKVVINESVSTGWMDMRFTVLEFLDKAEMMDAIQPLPSASNRTDATSAVNLSIKKNSDTATVWLIQGKTTEFVLGDELYQAIYGMEQRPVGFEIELKDFIIDTDPGTNRPASFKSDVILRDVAKGIEREQTIQMNEPLDHRGFKVYQSAYQIIEGQPDVSIFSVAKDPGIWLKYSGAIIMVSGIVLLFYFRKYSTLKTSDPKLRNVS